MHPTLCTLPLNMKQDISFRVEPKQTQVVEPLPTPQTVRIEVHQPTARYSWRWSLIWFVLMAGTIGLTALFGRQWIDSLLARLDYQQAAHRDQTTLETGVKSQVRPTVALVYKNQNGEIVQVLADAQAYSDFVRTYTPQLQKQRLIAQMHAKQRLHKEFTKIFTTLRQRVARFADWYFGYLTTYKLMGLAFQSTALHATSLEAQSLSDAVAYDLTQYLQKHYQDIVLRPEITDVQLRQAYLSALQAGHHEYQQMISSFDEAFQKLVIKNTTHAQPAIPAAELIFDWHSQFNKFTPTEYEKNPTSLTAALAVGGGIAGKALGGAIAKGTAAKLAAPFVSKALAVGSSGALGALGGPVGAVAGVAVGLGIDYSINSTVALVQRENFIADVNDALTTTQHEWEMHLTLGLEQTINVWFDDTLHLLPVFSKAD